MDMDQGWQTPFGTGDKQRSVLHLLARTRSTGESQVDRRDALPFDWGGHAVMYDEPESWAAVRGADTNFHKGRGQNTRSSDFSGLRMRDGSDFFIYKLGPRWTQPPQSAGTAGKPAKSLKNSWHAPVVV